MNSQVDVVSWAKKTTEKYKNTPVSIKTECGDGKTLIEILRTRGFAVIDLPPNLVTKILNLEKLAYTTLYSHDESKKRKLGKIFRNSKEFKNYFTYAYLSGPGKETWRFRAINSTAKESINIPPFPFLDLLFDQVFSVMADLHQVGLDVLSLISHSIHPEVASDYLLSHSEPILHCEDLPFGLSHINLLRYFDSSKPVPVNPHTDQYMLTILPLNSGIPALEAWDLSQEKWIPLEVEAASQGKMPFSSAVILVGETLSRITNDYLVSTLHRVVAPSSVRFSCPFFLSAAKNTILDGSMYICPGGAFGENNTLKPVEVGQYLWEITCSPNQTETTIMKRWKKSVGNL